MDKMFQEQKSDPPVNKCQPPVAGAIAWERSLFHRIKHTIIRFQTEHDMMNTEMGKQVCGHFSLILKLSFQFRSIEIETC